MTGHDILSYTSTDGEGNGSPWLLRVIPNRQPVLRTELALEREGIGMFDRITGVGAHEIIIEGPDHGLILHEYPVPQIKRMLAAWRERGNDLRKDSRLRYISVFRNQGRRAGARLSHPHSQLIATPLIPSGIRGELAGAREYYEYKERCVFCDLIDQEREEKARIVSQNRGFLAFCPFASRHPFEVWILPRLHRHDFGAATEEQLDDLAEIFKETAAALAISLQEPDMNVILKTAPYPVRRRDKWTTLEEDYHWRLEMIPRICRASGYEWATGMFVNPTPPEEAAAYLRETLFKAGRR
jgi:UDPglucose--hexose-1-phosphate uridylyltransferase